jgi:hypothetical protein
MEGNILLSTRPKTSVAKDVAKDFRRFSENRLAQSDARGLQGKSMLRTIY